MPENGERRWILAQIAAASFVELLQELALIRWAAGAGARDRLIRVASVPGAVARGARALRLLNVVTIAGGGIECMPQSRSNTRCAVSSADR